MNKVPTITDEVPLEVMLGCRVGGSRIPMEQRHLMQLRCMRAIERKQNQSTPLSILINWLVVIGHVELWAHYDSSLSVGCSQIVDYSARTG